MNVKFLLLPLVAVVYFSISWFFPWNIIQFDSNISVSYIFDVIFFLSVFGIFQKKEYVGQLDKTKSLIRGAFCVLWAFICVGIAINSTMVAPFKFVDNLFLQILVLAPLIEELVFRGAFFDISEKLKIPSKIVLAANAILFSLSHLPALWYLEQEFHSFIYFQIFYTIILGWVCAKARLETRGLAEPILLHLFFNGTFYLAVTNYGL